MTKRQDGTRKGQRTHMLARLKVRVTAGAREDAILGWRDGILRLRVKSPPERGKANAAVVALLAKQLGVPRGSLTIERGAAYREKTVRVNGLDEGEAQRRLDQVTRTARARPG